MDKTQATDPRDLDWSEYESSMPRTGIVHPQGRAKVELTARMQKAFATAKVRHTA